MPILVKPFLGCNLNCEYCYETQHRKQHQTKMDYDLQAVLTAMEEQAKLQGNGSNHKDVPPRRKKKGVTFGLHGGEPLMMPKKDVEAILAKANELTKDNEENRGCSVQTNATLVDEEWIAIFKKYGAHVGFSLDGPGELNRFRMSPEQADKIMKLIHRIIEQEGMRVAVMCVLSKANVGTPELLARFKEWLLELRQLECGGSMNPCGHSPKHQIDPIALADIMLDLAKFQFENGMSWRPFIDMALQVRGEKGAVCSFMGCDIFHTPSCTVILGDGSITNCMRTNQGDIIMMHPAKYDTRDEILQDIPQENGGCRGCEFWEPCRGGCPMMAIDDDWRNRTYLCPVRKKLLGFYTAVTRSLKIPVGKEASDRIWRGHPGHTDTGRSGHTDTKPGHQDNHRDFPPSGGKRRSVC